MTITDLSDPQKLGKEWARTGRTVEALLAYLAPGSAVEGVLSVALAAYVAELKDQLFEEAQHDGLTQLPNRAAFARHFEIECARAVRYERVLTLVLLDLDGFKQINDSQGHLAGDAALQQFARWLTAALRQSDMAFRYGGDEFAMLLPETTALAAQSVMQRLAEQVALEKCAYSFSWGWATLPDDAATMTALVSCADARLYAHKRAPRQALTA